jgi:hypothetical protein
MHNLLIEFGREACRDLAVAANREWLETNGLAARGSSNHFAGS